MRVNVEGMSPKDALNAMSKGNLPSISLDIHELRERSNLVDRGGGLE